MREHRRKWWVGPALSVLTVLSVLLAVAILWVWAARAGLEGSSGGGGLMMPFWLDPQTYASPSGEYALFVDPSRPDGGGEGRYRFTRDGQELWSGARPWTLQEAVVGDDGLVAGYAYGAGPRGGAGDSLTILVLDAEGTARVEDRRARSGVEDCFSRAEPTVAGLFVDRDDDRLVVRLRGQWEKRERWWTYSLSDGALGPELSPWEEAGEDDHLAWIAEIHALPGTGLTLLRWMWLDHPDQGAVYTLHESDGELRWRLDWPTDYSLHGAMAAERLRKEVDELGAITVEAAGRFTLRRVATDERVTFEARRAGSVNRAGSANKVEVREVARAAYEPPRAVHGPETRQAEVELELAHLGTIALGEDPAPSAIHDVAAFAFDGLGRLGAICANAEGSDFVLVTSEGQQLAIVALPRPAADEPRAVRLAWIDGERWILCRRSAAWWLDAASGSTTSIEGFDAPEVASVVGTGDGGFVVAGKRVPRHGHQTYELAAFGRDGKPRWALGSDERPGLWDLETVTLTSDGRLAVLGGSRDLVQLFSKGGRFEELVELEQAWGRKPRRLLGIRPDRDGGTIVHEPDDEHPVVRMDRGGRVTGRFRPRFADGRAFPNRDVQLAPDGTLWTHDGHALLALDEAGVVQRSIGAMPDPEHLGIVSELAIGPRDRLYAMDERTGCVHAFDPDGTRAFTCRPRVEELFQGYSQARLRVSAAGEVFFYSAYEHGLLHFGSDGTRLPDFEFPFHAPHRHWLEQPATGRTWFVGMESVGLVRAAGEVVRSSTRAPDGTWLRALDDAAVAPDGSLGVATSAHACTSSRARVSPCVRWGFPRAFGRGVASHSTASAWRSRSRSPSRRPLRSGSSTSRAENSGACPSGAQGRGARRSSLRTGASCGSSTASGASSGSRSTDGC